MNVYLGEQSIWRWIFRVKTISVGVRKTGLTYRGNLPILAPHKSSLGAGRLNGNPAGSRAIRMQ